MRRLLAPVAASLAVIGAAGLSLIQESEGLRLTTYRDAVGIPTVCYGHTGPDVRMGQTYTRDQCETILLRDIQVHQAVITPGNPRNCIGNVPITPNQRDGLTAFIFNVGTGSFCRSTMARKLRARDYLGASMEFGKWNKARVGGRLTVLRGLTTRRERERRLFVTSAPPAPSTASSGLFRGIFG